jgi:curli biogenesis system outer membrane secretion channel CsgG
VQIVRLLAVLAVCSTFIGGCSRAPAGATQSEQLREAPDFGGVVSQHVEVDGVGVNRAAAIDDALRTALKEVNGVALSEDQAQLSLATTISSDQKTLDIDSETFARLLASHSGGLVSGFKIISEKRQRTDWLFGPYEWRVKISADIAKYREASSANRPRLVVAAARGPSGSFAFGDEGQSAAAISAAVQSRLSSAISQTNRFTVIDRQASEEIQTELDAISSGSANPTDTARLGQQLAADLIVIPTVERMEYARHAQPLALSGRELVSYSGGATISFRVVNATTGQLVLSDRFTAEFPTTQPTTLGAHVDVHGATDRALSELTDRFVSELLEKTFPISVVAMTGSNVVLSQGGSAVKQGAVYRAVWLGAALTDPQTGQSLGRTEQDIGTIQISRSDPNVSYGELQLSAALPGSFRPGAIELRELTPVPPPLTAAANRDQSAHPPRRAIRAADASRQGPRAATDARNDKDW